MSQFKMEALQARPDLNPQLYTDRQYMYILKPDGKKLYLSDSTEGIKFALECRCGQYHVRYATLHAITEPGDLFCQWCEHDDPSWKARKKDHVSAAEVDAMKALKSAGLDHYTACQVVLPFWHGRLDFYHIRSKSAMLVDGSSHFRRMHLRAPQVQLLKDIECCTEAWKKGARLLRVHHEYAHFQEAMVIATQLPYERFVMLTGCYQSVVIWCDDGYVQYTDWLTLHLRGARMEQIAPAGCKIFY